MSEHVESVKRAWGLVKKSADGLREKSPMVAAERDALAESLLRASEEMVRLAGLTKALPPDLGNIHDLPQELLDELSAAKTDEAEDQIVTVINACGGEASLDQILVGLYRKFKVMQKRRFLQNKLYRMDMVWSVDGKKGVYTTTKPDDPVSADKEMMEEREDRQGRRADLDEEIPF